MPKVEVYNIEGKAVGSIELSENIFGAEVNHALIHQVVKAQLANRRQGTKGTLTRSEVSGGGIKPFRQKGTGRARQGSTRAPQWTHGGIVFAPKARDFRMAIPKKMRRAALKGVLTSKVADEQFTVVDQFNIAAPKTKEMAKALDNLKATKRVLLVLPGKDEVVERAVRNIPNVQTAYINTLNVLDVLNADSFVITQDAVRLVEEVYA